MKIASASLQLNSSHVETRHRESSRSLTVVNAPRAGAADRPRHPGPADKVSLSSTGQATQAAEAGHGSADSTVNLDPRLNLIRFLLEQLTGRQIKVFDPSRLRPADAPPSAGSGGDAPPAAATGVELDAHDAYTETEQTAFSARGKVKTADGRELDIQLQLSMSRAYHEASDLSLRLGAAARQSDPLVVNFAGTAAQLTDQRFAFDLNGDGNPEQINFVGPGSGFLAIDRNQDGRVNDGSELFGPGSGNGFADLAAYDDDGNGWVDENDGAFGQLRIWTRDAGGNDRLAPLAATGVGAISLNPVATPFSLKTNDNRLLGKIRTTGIVLQEDGTAGTIQQIDLTT